MSDNQKQTIVILWEKTKDDNLRLDSGNSFVCAICGDIFEEDATVRRAVRLLQDALREINQRVLTAEGWRLSNLENLQRQVNDIMERFRRQYTDVFAEIQTSAYRLGAQSVD